MRLVVLLPVLVAAVSPADDAPDVSIGEPTLLGTTGLSINGQVHPHGVPTTWHVDYGPTDAYGQRTAAQPVPPRLAAHYRETWDTGWNGWNSWCPKRLHFPAEGVSGGYISYEGSPRDDHNHDDGIGTVHLTPYMYPGSVSLSDGAPSAYLAGGDPDFRDAIIRQSVRGRDWQPHGTELMWWSQAQSNIEANPDDHTLAPDYKHPNWCYTGRSLTDLLATGNWETAEYRLLNDTNFWTYCGNRDGEARYDAYWSINETQRHLNLDLFHMVVFVDPQNPPTGAIDFDEFEVTYRNDSLVFPSNGGRLVASPAGSPDDPATLTDGWRHGAGRMWSSASDPADPLEFEYEFAAQVTIEKVQLHQHPEWPAKEVEVLSSPDGVQWQSIVRGDMPERHPHGPNYAFLLRKKLAAPATRVKVRILSGYRPERWGLGEIELFGAGAAFQPDDDWFHVNVDLVDLPAGGTVHYRLVATNAYGTTSGPDRQFTLPPDARPHVVTGAASRVAGGAATLDGRLNPLGQKTEFYFEYGPTTAYGSQTRPWYGGLQITPRLCRDQLTGLQPGATYHYRFVAVNATGTSHGADATFVAQ